MSRSLPWGEGSRGKSVSRTGRASEYGESGGAGNEDRKMTL